GSATTLRRECFAVSTTNERAVAMPRCHTFNLRQSRLCDALSRFELFRNRQLSALSPVKQRVRSTSTALAYGLLKTGSVENLRPERIYLYGKGFKIGRA